MEVLFADYPILTLVNTLKLVNQSEFLKTSCCKSVCFDRDIYREVKLGADFLVPQETVSEMINLQITTANSQDMDSYSVLRT